MGRASSKRVTWFLIVWPPLAFLLVLAAASVRAVRRGATSSQAVGDEVQGHIPVLLAITLAVVGLALCAVSVGSEDVRQGLGATLRQGSWLGVAAGSAVGAAVAALYFGGLDRAVERLQHRFGDYVPAGSTGGLGSDRSAFFIANVLLAPAVEEVWYRGALFDALGPVLPPIAAAVVGCLAFGLFHWPGGAWYVAVTGVLVGGPCWLLRAWDGGIAAPYAAHLTLNAVEYVVLTRRVRRAR